MNLIFSAFNGHVVVQVMLVVHFRPLHTAAFQDCLICQHARALHTMHN